MKVRRWLMGLGVTVLISASTACTPQQIADWVAWNERDPVAAQEFAALPWVQDLLREGQQQAQQQRSSGGGGNSVWDRLAQCESGGNWSINTGNGYYGGLQFLPSTWRTYGGQGMPHNASREEQIRIAERVQDDVGWGAWPACTRKMGLR